MNKSKTFLDIIQILPKIVTITLAMDIIIKIVFLIVVNVLFMTKYVLSKRKAFSLVDDVQLFRKSLSLQSLSQIFMLLKVIFCQREHRLRINFLFQWTVLPFTLDSEPNQNPNDITLCLIISRYWLSIIKPLTSRNFVSLAILDHCEKGKLRDIPVFESWKSIFWKNLHMLDEKRCLWFIVALGIGRFLKFGSIWNEKAFLFSWILKLIQRFFLHFLFFFESWVLNIHRFILARRGFCWKRLTCFLLSLFRTISFVFPPQPLFSQWKGLFLLFFRFLNHRGLRLVSFVIWQTEFFSRSGLGFSILVSDLDFLISNLFLVILQFIEVFLGMTTNLGDTPSFHMIRNHHPFFSILVDALISNELPLTNRSCSSSLHLP